MKYTHTFLSDDLLAKDILHLIDTDSILRITNMEERTEYEVRPIGHFPIHANRGIAVIELLKAVFLQELLVVCRTLLDEFLSDCGRNRNRVGYRQRA